MPHRSDRPFLSLPICSRRASGIDSVPTSSYPYEGPKLHEWLQEVYRPGHVIETFDLLGKLNTHIYQSVRYAHRDEPGVQLPCETLKLGSGSCRDFAVLMME